MPLPQLHQAYRLLKEEVAHVDPRTDSNLFNALSVCVDQTAYAIAMLEKREAHRNENQGKLEDVMITQPVKDGKTAATGEHDED